MGCAQKVPSVCLGDAWRDTKWAQCVKHTPFDQNMLTMFNQGYTQHFFQFNTRMSYEHFVKHIACNSAQHTLTMHEHDEICCNTCLECHMRPTQIHKDQMRLSPIKILKKFSQNHEPQTIFKKSPISETLSKFLHNRRQNRRKCFRKHTLKLKMQKTSLRVKGFQ